MSLDTTEAILARIREAGYAVEAGTAGYQVRMVATGPDGQAHEVTRPSEHEAAVALAEAVSIDPQA